MEYFVGETTTGVNLIFVRLHLSRQYYDNRDNMNSTSKANHQNQGQEWAVLMFARRNNKPFSVALLFS